MSYEIVPYSDRAEWLQLRRTGIGASDIPALLGISQWGTTPRMVWMAKVIDEAPELEATDDMAWGLRTEALVVDEACRQLSADVVLNGPLLRSVERPWMMATPDSLCELREASEMVVVEAKNSHDWSWDEEIPPDYVVQVQWQLAVTEYERAWLAVQHRGRRPTLYPVERDEEVIAELVAAGERFWLEHVVPVVPPPVAAADDPFLSVLWPQHIEAAVEVDEDLAVELRAAKAAAKAATERLQLAEARVKEIMGEASTAVTPDGEPLATWKTQTARRINLQMLKAEEPELAETYTKESTSRVFRLKEGK